MLKVLEISISVVFALIVLGAAASAQYILAINYIKFQRAAKVAVFFHVINGGIATIVGPLQFLQRLRNKYPIIHRVLQSVAAFSLTDLSSLCSGMEGFIY